MPIHATLELPLLTKLPAQAVGEAVRVIRQCARLTPESTLDVILMATSHCGVLRALALRLSEGAQGFKLGVGESVTAAEFLRVAPPGGRSLVTYAGNLAAEIGFDTGLELILAMTEQAPIAVRSTSFSLVARQLCWRGTALETGELVLDDSKVFKRTRRFHLALGVTLPGHDPRDALAKACLASIENETGLPFAKAKRCALPDGPAARAATGKRLVPPDSSELYAEIVAKACIEDGLERVAAGLRAITPRRPELPGLVEASAVLDARLSAGTASGPRPSLPRQVKALMARLPGFTCRCEDGEELRYHRALTADLEIVLVFERKHLHGLGKAFCVQLGVAITAGPKAGLLHTDSVFRAWYASTNQPPTFVYASREELAGIFEGLEAWLDHAIPVMESVLCQRLSPFPVSLPSDLPRRAPQTASEALTDARQALAPLDPAARLVGVSCHALPGLRLPHSAAIDLEGRRRDHGKWVFRFVHSDGASQWWVEVPAIGHARVSRLGGIAGAGQPLDTDWLDSDRAVGLAIATLAERAAVPKAASLQDVYLTLESPRRAVQLDPAVVSQVLRALGEADAPHVQDMRRLLEAQAKGPTGWRWAVRMRYDVGGDRLDLGVTFDAATGRARALEYYPCRSPFGAIGGRS